MASIGAVSAAAFLVVFFFVSHAYAYDKCAAGCHGASQPRDGFVQGNTYTYWLDGVASIRLSGASKQETSVKLSARATVVALGNCANLLKVTSLQITGNDGTEYSKPQNIEKAVRFTLQDGVLGSNICAEAGDSHKSLNIKRALLSLLQTATKHNTEVDVFGICPTTFTVSSDGATISKSRNLNTCAHREQGKRDLLSYIYNSNSEIKTSHILQSDMKVDVVLKNGIVERVEAQEDYLYRPFSAGQAGARGAVTTKLLLKETSRGTLHSKCTVPRSIIFENPHTVKTDRSDVSNLFLALHTATRALDIHVEDKSAVNFLNLIKVLRLSSKEDMLDVYGKIKGDGVNEHSNFVKRVFLDALFRAGTGDSAEASITLLQKKELTPLQQKLALLSLTTVRHASAETLKAATSLLDVADVSNELLLGVGALAGAYCRDHPCHGSGSRDAGVAALSAKLASKLGDCKSGSRKAEDMIISALKGLRNIHHLEDSVVDKLARCAADKSVNQRVRVAALETFSADACISKLKSTALDILKDTQQDSELRIKAYLALLECPCANVAGELKTLLDSEPVHQVGSYITSSLRNIRASTNPARESAKQYFSAIIVSNKFSMDVRKYSQNYEASYEVESLGVGSVVEGNVIYSQDSFLPRSANLNLTAEIFGIHVNLIELGMRQGNLDRFVEVLFGPHGFFKSHPLFKESPFYKRSPSSPDNTQDASETKDDVQKLIYAFGDKLKTDIKGYHGDVDLDIFVKLFGTESVFLSLGDDDHSISAKSLVDGVLSLVFDGIPESKRFSHEVRNHMLFLDMELAYPTFSGMDLKLTLEGAATSKLKFGGHFDTKKIIKDPQNANFEIVLVPSANVEISGALSIDADVVVHGLKVVATLHTSTGNQLSFSTTAYDFSRKILEKGFDLQIKMPIAKQEIFSATSEVFFYRRKQGHRDVDTKVTFDTKEWKQNGCFDQLSDAVGVTLCSELTVPWKDSSNHAKKTPSVGPVFPLNGHAKLAVNLEKDEFYRLNIHGKMKVTDDDSTHWTLDLEAKGHSKVSFLLEQIYKQKVRSIKAVMNSSHKYMDARAAMIKNEHEESFSAGFKVDDDDYNIKAGVEKLDETTYKPVFDCTLPDKSKPISVEGTITIQPEYNKFILNNICLVVKDDRITIDGFVALAKYIESDLKMTFRDHAVSFRAIIKSINQTMHGDVEFHNTIHPGLDVLLNYKYFDSEDMKSFDLTLVHGPDSKSEINKFSYNIYLQGELEELTECESQTKLSYPAAGLSLDGKFAVDPKNIAIILNGQHQYSKAEFEMVIKDALKRDEDLYGKIKVKLNDKGFVSESNFEAESDSKGAFSNKLLIYPSDTYEIAGIVKYQIEEDLDLGLDAKFITSENSEDCKISVGVVYSSSNCNSHLKLSRGRTDYVDALFNAVLMPTHSGTLKVIINDIVRAEGEFKVDPDNRGNGVLIIELSKIYRVLKLETAFMVADPQYNIAIDIFPNFDQDHAQKISFTTTTNTAAGSSHSVNDLTINGYETGVHIASDESGELMNGKYNALLEVSRSSGKSLNVQWQREAASKGDDLKASMELNFAYVSKKGAHPTKLTHKGRIVSMNKRTGRAEGEHHFYIVTDAGEDLDLKLAVKIEPKNQRNNVDIKFEAAGAICPENIVYSSSVDYFDGESDEQCDAKYRVKGLYGEKASMDVTGSYSLTVPETADATFDSDVNMNIVLPLDRARDIKLFSVDRVVIPHAEHKYIEFTSKRILQVNANTYKYEAALQLAEHEGKVKISALVPRQETLALESSYSSQEGKDNTKKFNSILNVDCGTGKQLHLTVERTRQETEGDVTVTVALPANLKAKRIVTNIKYKTPEPRSFSSDMNVDVDGKKYTLSSEVDLRQKYSSLVDIKATSPEASPARIYIKTQKSGEHQYKGVSKLEHLRGFNMDMTIDAKIVTPEDFDITLDVHSAKLMLNKVHFAAKSEEAGRGTRKVHYSAKENGKDILSGLTTFRSRQEGNKFIVEGFGNVNVKGEQKATSFKYIRDTLNEANENGVEVFFNVAMGEKNIIIEHKATTLEYKLSSAYCEDKKQCARVDINNKLDTSVPHRLSQKLELGFDLRKLGFAPEFGLQTSTELERFKLPAHSLDIHLSQDKSKYNVQVFAKPVKGVYQTAVTLTTPHRVISLESATSSPDSQMNNPFPITHETVFFLNKNDPGSRTQLKIAADFQRADNKQVSTNGEVFFSCPSLGKDLEIAGKAKYDVSSYTASSELVLDIFKKKAQKVVVTFKLQPNLIRSNEIINTQFSYDIEGHVNGRGLGFDILLEEKFFLSSQQLKLSSVAALTLDNQRKAYSALLNAVGSKYTFVLAAPNVEILRVESGWNNADFKTKVYSEICALGERTYRASGELSLRPPISIILSAGFNDNSAKVVISCTTDSIKKIGFKAEHFDGNKSLLLASYILDNEGTSIINVINSRIEHVIEKASTELGELVTKGIIFQKQQNEQTLRDFQKLTQCFMSASPDFSGLIMSYQQELQNISEELNTDKYFQQLTNTIQTVFRSVSKVATEITDKLVEIFNHIGAVFMGVLDVLQQVWAEKLLPGLTSLFEKVADTAGQVLGGVKDVGRQVVIYLAGFSEIIMDYMEPILKRINKYFIDLIPRIEAVVGAVLEKCSEFYYYLSEYIEELRVKLLEEYKITKMVEEFLHRCHGLSPTEELKSFFDVLILYMDKVFNMKIMIESKEWEVIYSKFIAAVDSLIGGIVATDTPNAVPGSFDTLPLSFGGLSGLPSPLSPKFSILNYLWEETNFNQKQIFKSFWPKSLNPLDALPPNNLLGLVAGGQHIFTFDSRHMTFPGNCRYILAQDAVDGNFSIIMNLEKGNPKSVTLWDKSKNAVEVNDKTQLTLNGQKHGFPVIETNIVAWKDGQTFVIQSEYGASIKCTYNLDLCTVEVSGFYLGRLRGLLGDGNNEPFDDFRLPSGQICTSESEFGNSYALTPDCQQVNMVDHSDHRGHHGNVTGGICSKIFGEKSNFKTCDVSVDIKNYRQACQHATMSGGPEADEDACLIAKAYVQACQASGIPVRLPAKCAACQVDGTVYQLGQEFKVKTPQKQADILIAIETTKDNEKTFNALILPLLSAVIDELKTKKIDDVRVQLVGISPKAHYPIHYDTENIKLKGNKMDFKDEERSSDWEFPIVTENLMFNEILNLLAVTLQAASVELGIDNLHQSYTTLGTRAQWRPKAVKTIIMVHSESCDYAKVPVIQFLGECLTQGLMEDAGIVAHLIAPLDQLTAEIKNVDSIVGFNSDHVFILGDKKRGLSHADLREDLEHEDDQCVSYAEETFGNVYSSSNFFAMNANQQKKFIQMASHTLVDSLAAVSVVSKCKCQMDWLTPAVSCRVQTRRAIKKRGTKKK